MLDLELEEREIDTINRWTGISVPVIREYRQISTDDAISRFLSQESKDILTSHGYKTDPQSREEKLRQSLVPLELGVFKDDFYKSEEGKLWFDCNVPDVTRVSIEALKSAQEYRKQFPNQGVQISWGRAIGIISGYR